MGTPNFAVPILKTLVNSKHKILKVYTQSPKKKERGLKINFSPIYNFCRENIIDIKHPEKLNSKEEINNIKNLKPDIVIVVAYGKILSEELLNLKDVKFINIHASLLPRWRGAAPIQRAIMNLDKITGISIMKIVPKLDAGPVMMKKEISISKEVNFIDLSLKLSNLAAGMILECMDLIEKKKDYYISQKEKDVTYAKKITKKESKINWNEKASLIVAKINALYPNPGSWFKLNGQRIKPIKVKEVDLKGSPGTVVSKNFVVACTDNAVQILELQREGKKPMTTNEFLKGFKLDVGIKLNLNE